MIGFWVSLLLTLLYLRRVCSFTTLLRRLVASGSLATFHKAQDKGLCHECNSKPLNSGPKDPPQRLASPRSPLPAIQIITKRRAAGFLPAYSPTIALIEPSQHTMRFLQVNHKGEFSLTKDLINDIHPYAILSHTWGDEEKEVTFKDLTR
jgi:hypothetical protein